MSDEHEPQTDDNEFDEDTSTDTETNRDTTADVPPPGDQDSDDGDGPGVDVSGPTESGAPDAGSAERGQRWVRSIANLRIGGRLVIHHVSRDVTLLADGDAAIRAIEYFAHREGRGDLDRLSSQSSSAEFGWVSIDLTGVIGISWRPGFDDGDTEDRLTFDPLVRAA